MFLREIIISERGTTTPRQAGSSHKTPTAGATKTPSAYIRYLYANADPVDNIDPSGNVDINLPSIATLSAGIANLSATISTVAFNSLLFFGNTATFVAENAIEIEFYGLLGAGALELVNTATANIVNNDEPIQYKNDNPGDWVEGKLGANATSYEIIDDFRDGNATSIKVNSQTMDRCLGVIGKEARTLANRKQDF